MARRRVMTALAHPSRSKKRGASAFVLDHSVFERSMPSDLIRGWTPVRVKKTRQNKRVEPGSDAIRTGALTEMPVDRLGHEIDEGADLGRQQPRGRIDDVNRHGGQFELLQHDLETLRF